LDPRFQQRKVELLADCQVPPAAFRGAIRRLERFAQPFVATFPGPERREYFRISLAGLLSDVKPKNAETIASRHDLERQTLRRFVGSSPWDHDPLSDELTRPVARDRGRPDAVLVFDPSAFPKKGGASVGVKRHGCGRRGKVENGQVGVSLGDVADDEHALVDFRRSVPAEGAKDQARRTRCGLPKEVKSQTRPRLAFAMLKQRGGALPPGGVGGDDERGRPAWFRKEWAKRGARDR
jgi:SRSO17 transposase